MDMDGGLCFNRENLLSEQITWAYRISVLDVIVCCLYSAINRNYFLSSIGLHIIIAVVKLLPSVCVCYVRLT